MTYQMTPFGGHPTLNDGLVSYFNCNDNHSDLVVRNAVHSGNNGTATDNTDTLNTTGKINKSFNSPIPVGGKGFEAQVEAYPGEIFHIDKDWSVSMWVYFENSGTTDNIMATQQGSGSIGWGIARGYIAANEGFIVQFYNGTDLRYIYETGGDHPFPAGAWIHAVVVFDHTLSTLPDACTKVYVDGLGDFTTNTAGSGSPITAIHTPNPLMCGNSLMTYGNFKGKLSDVGIWNKVLISSEVSALFNMSHGRARDMVKCNLFDNNPTLAESCLAEWGLEDNAATTDVIEATGRFWGTCTTNTDVLSVAGGLFGGNLLDFSLSASKHITIHDIAPYVGWGKKFSWEIWFYGNTTTRRLIGSNYTLTDAAFDFYIYTNTVYVTAASVASAGSTKLTKGVTLLPEWNHLIYTYDGNSDTQGVFTGSKVYFNGSEIVMIPTYVGNQVDFGPSTMHIGSIGSTAYDNDKLSLTRFFANKTLNQDEVTYLNNNQLGRKSL